ncbi:hypothetical protein [Megasphaera sueciensis]|uniref:hypothetical protein n=1 Tax=Megasphaera sueciensis TaxID=349094 RepID=UPI003CFCCE49|nr:DUF1492 domain-containing protein [Megasphaera sp.]
MIKKGQRTQKDPKKQTVQFIFYHKQVLKRAVREAREESLSMVGHTGGSGGHAFVSDSTAVQGIKLATKLKYVTLRDGIVIDNPGKWIRVIDSTYDSLDDIERRAVKMRYEGSYWRRICDKLNMGRTMYYKILEKADNHAIEIAIDLGLIHVV